MNRTARTMKPSQLRAALSVSLIALFAGGAALFGLAYTQLQTFGNEVAAKNGEAKASDNSLGNLQATKKFLDSNTALITQTNAFVLKRDLPQFQIREDIIHYADLYGLPKVQVGTTAAGTASSTPGAGTATPTAPATTPATGAAPAAGAAGKQLGVSVSFAGEVDYANFVKFLYAIEHNLPKMTVDGISLSAPKGGNVTVAPFTINTYI